jgi:hypothetical protein
MPNLKTLLFPAEPRRIPYARGLNILFRVIHLIGISGSAAGFFFAIDEAHWLPFWYLALASGIGLSALYIAASAEWLLQLKGLAILAKLLILATSLFATVWRAELFIVVIAISGLIAHAPSKIRGWRWDGRGNGRC